MLDAADPALTRRASASGREPLPGWVREMAADVDLAALCERVVARDIAVAFPDLAEDAGFAEHLRASVRENLRLLQDVLSGRLPLDAVRLEQPLVFARVQAELRIPQTALQRSYRVGFAEMWRAWADRLQEVADADDVPRTEAVRALAQLTTAIFDYQDHVASQVAESYARAWCARSCAGTGPRWPPRTSSRSTTTSAASTWSSCCRRWPRALPAA